MVAEDESQANCHVTFVSRRAAKPSVIESGPSRRTKSLNDGPGKVMPGSQTLSSGYPQLKPGLARSSSTLTFGSASTTVSTVGGSPPASTTSSAIFSSVRDSSPPPLRPITPCRLRGSPDSRPHMTVVSPSGSGRKSSVIQSPKSPPHPATSSSLPRCTTPLKASPPKASAGTAPSAVRSVCPRSQSVKTFKRPSSPIRSNAINPGAPKYEDALLNFGFQFNEVVIWTAADPDIPAGTKGSIIGFTDDRVRVSFPKGVWTFKPTELLKASECEVQVKFGFRAGEEVLWTACDKDIPAGTKGSIINFTTDRVRVQFPRGMWTFKPEELIKASQICQQDAMRSRSPTRNENINFVQAAKQQVSNLGNLVQAPQEALIMTRQQLVACGRRACGKDPFVEDLQLNDDGFDPQDHNTKSQLLSLLGLTGAATIEVEQFNCGGINHGVWNLSCKSSNRRYTLKLVDSHRRHATLPTDAERFSNLFAECPEIVQDKSLAFPMKVLMLRKPNGSRAQDLIVMPQAMGQQLSMVISHKTHAKEQVELQAVIKSFGRYLSSFHQKYKGMAHGDCQPSNVFYDAKTGQFTLIDLGGMGPAPEEKDVSQFTEGLCILTKWYGGQLMNEMKAQFLTGYYGDATQLLRAPSVARIRKNLLL